uniref:Uncharacterized protein n=1 Tax=Cacopsylla melanoneura TaxID=428564 RepID=A0A8D9FHU3_9HEMI
MGIAQTHCTNQWFAIMHDEKHKLQNTHTVSRTQIINVSLSLVLLSLDYLPAILLRIVGCVWLVAGVGVYASPIIISIYYTQHVDPACNEPDIIVTLLNE